MTSEEHVKIAKDFLLTSDREFEAGDRMQASEKLWGAASQAMLAVCEKKGWPGGRHSQLKNAADRLALERHDPMISSDFAVAEKFHRNFYHDFMEDFELESDRPKVRAFVGRVLELV